MPPGVAPDAVLDAYHDTTVAATGDVTFTGQRRPTMATRPGIAAYTFDFGDGSDPVITTATTVAHRHVDAGTFTVRLPTGTNRTRVPGPRSSPIDPGSSCRVTTIADLPGGTTTGVTHRGCSGCVRPRPPLAASST